jgi:aspartyl-tRNA(Asn)/glutamyl-tRNA(Gln) amidotransferase subunit B
MQQAIEYEARRQIDLIEDGGSVVQETRLYDPERNETRSMRTKEDAMDYRYFPDPDLLSLEISPQWIERVRGELPELPGAMRERFLRDYALSEYDAQTLTASKHKGQFFENVARQCGDAKVAANWIIGEVSAALNEQSVDTEQLDSAEHYGNVSASQLAGLIARVLDGTVNQKTAKEVFAALWAGEGTSADAIIESRRLRQISDTGAIERIVDEVLAANAKSVEEFRAGKEKAFNALVGQAMKATKGKANPAQVNEILRRRLTS